MHFTLLIYYIFLCSLLLGIQFMIGCKKLMKTNISDTNISDHIIR